MNSTCISLRFLNCSNVLHEQYEDSIILLGKPQKLKFVISRWLQKQGISSKLYFIYIIYITFTLGRPVCVSPSYIYICEYLYLIKHQNTLLQLDQGRKKVWQDATLTIDVIKQNNQEGIFIHEWFYNWSLTSRQEQVSLLLWKHLNNTETINW